MNYVNSELRNSGYEVLSDTSQQVTGRHYYLDILFGDTLVFSAEQALDLSSHKLIQEGCLVIQVLYVWRD